MPGSLWIHGANPRDHDLVEDKDHVIYVVVGNEHPMDSILGYPKYIPVKKRTPWRRRNQYFLRIPTCYEVNHIYEKAVTRSNQVFDPKYGAMVLGVKRKNVIKYYEPHRRLMEILASPKDILEADVVEIIYHLNRLGLPTKSLGITGSVLLGIHNSDISDIDLIVYGCREAFNLIENLEKRKSIPFKPLTGKMFSNWIKCHSISYGLPKSLVKEYYAIWRRLTYYEREVSLIYVDPQPQEWYYRQVYTYLGPAKVRVYVEPWQCKSIYYPSKTLATVEEVLKGPTIPIREVEIVSYESLYTKPLVYGGELIVEGALYRDTMDEYRLLVGVREHRGYIINVSHRD